MIATALLRPAKSPSDETWHHRGVKIVATITALLLTACAGDRNSVGNGPEASSTVRFETAAGSAELRVRVADTREERADGLTGVEALPNDQGMAFVYDDPTTATYWMKDTPIPLSIAFVDGDGRVITIRDMEPCTADPCPMYGADAPYVLAIEANRGWFEDAGVGVGSRASFESDQRYGYG
jgi:hypothetical protein